MKNQILNLCYANLHAAENLENETRDRLCEAFARPEAENLMAQASTAFLGLEETPQKDRLEFANNYAAMHLSVLSVMAMKIRLDEQNLRPDVTMLIQKEMNDIIKEDVGLSGLPHHDLYDRFAAALTGKTDWRNAGLICAEARKFKNWLHGLRTQGPLEEALATLVIAEIWNASEYTAAAPVTQKALLRHMDAPRAHIANAYMSVHAGETEFGHFMHALKAFDLYADAKGISREDRLKILTDISGRYIQKLGKTFEYANQPLKYTRNFTAAAATV